MLPWMKMNYLKTFVECVFILFVIGFMYMYMHTMNTSTPVSGSAGKAELVTHPSVSKNSAVDVPIPAMRMSLGINRTYHGIDLMKSPTYQFDPHFKNPCWRERSALRCLPYFFVIGVMKCGTSEIWKYITSHPDYAKPNFHKEAQWFAKGRFRSSSYDSIDVYIEMFEKAATRINKTRGNDRRSPITGDASPSYLYFNPHWRYLPGNEDLEEPKYVILDYIHHFLPRSKIIIIFRDPVERLYSEYMHRLGERHNKYIASPEHFHELVLNGTKLYAECLKTRNIRACAYDERINEELLGVHMQLGFYHLYWKELTGLFPREQILVLQNKDLKDKVTVLNTLYRFLDMRLVSKLSRVKFAGGQSNSRTPDDVSQGDMLSETRKMLADFYKPHNEEMYRIMGDAAFLYSEN